MPQPKKRGVVARWLACVLPQPQQQGAPKQRQHGAHKGAGADAPAAAAVAAADSSSDGAGGGPDLAEEVSKKLSAAGAAAGTAAPSSSGIGVGVCSADPAQRGSCDSPSTSYPSAAAAADWDALGACMTTAAEMEAGIDAVLEGSIKSAQTLFARYDMDLDQRLRQQDYYDCLLELNLALPYESYQRMVDTTFGLADADRDGLLSLADFIPLYKRVVAARRAFRRQDHHRNGQIDRYDFHLVLRELGVDGGPGGLQQYADDAFSEADAQGRGIVNFGQVLLWYCCHLSACSRRGSSSAHEQ